MNCRAFLLAPLVLLVAAPAPAQSPDSNRVIAALRRAKLPIGKTFPITRRELGMAPFVTADMVRFLIPSLGHNKGGRVFACTSVQQAKRIQSYYDKLGEDSAALYSHTFRKGRAVIQINGDLPDAEAKKYGKVLSALPY